MWALRYRWLPLAFLTFSGLATASSVNRSSVSIGECPITGRCTIANNSKEVLGVANFQTPITHYFSYTGPDFDVHALVVMVTLLKPVVNCEGGVAVFISRASGGLTFDVPRKIMPHIDDDHKDYDNTTRVDCFQPKGEHQLCHDDGTNATLSVTIDGLTVDESYPYNLTISVVESLLEFEGIPKTIDVTSWGPRFVRLDFKGNDKMVIDVASNNDVKTIIALQDSTDVSTCPVRDLPRDSKFRSTWMTVTKKGVIIATAPPDGGHVNLVIVIDNDADQRDLLSTYVLTTRKALPLSDYVLPIMLFPIGINLLFVIICLTRCAVATRSRMKNENMSVSMSEMDAASMRHRHERPGWNGVPALYSAAVNHFYRSAKTLMVAALSRKVPSFQRRKSRRYLW